jgi:hypothetical protein
MREHEPNLDEQTHPLGAPSAGGRPRPRLLRPAGTRGGKGIVSVIDLVPDVIWQRKRVRP